jgi:WD40 repeat protein
MSRPLRKALLSAILALSGCHVAQQAWDAFTPSDTSKTLILETIPETSSLSFTNLAPAHRHDGEVISVQKLPSSSPTLASVGVDGRVIGWDLNSGKGFQIKKLDDSPHLAAIGERRALLAWASDRGLFITCLSGCSTVIELPRFKARPTALAFQDEDTSLLIGAADGRVYRWRFIDQQNVSSMEGHEKMVERYIGHQTMVSGVVAHSTGRAFFSSDWDGALLGWLVYTADDHVGEYDKNLFRGRFYTDIASNLRAPRPPDRGISSLAISEDGQRIAIGTEDGFVEVWTVRGFVAAARKQIHQGRIISIALTYNGARVASVGKDSKAKVSQLVEDPMSAISTTALPYSLSDVSEHTIPLAKGAVFAADDRLAISTKTGELVEVKLPSAQAREQAQPPARPTAHPFVSKDNDY